MTFWATWFLTLSYTIDIFSRLSLQLRKSYYKSHSLYLTLYLLYTLEVLKPHII